MIKNNLQAKIVDEGKKIRIKSMDYDALIYHVNIYDTLIYHKNINIKLFGFHKFCIPHWGASPIYACTSHACVQRWHDHDDGSMHSLRGGLLYFVVS